MATLVSILIPCFNAERWIAAAIESALAQTWPDKEVVVVDDGSSDGSLEIVQSFGDRIRWESGPNQGGNVARNRLLALAKGEWLQYLDADDYLLPGKIDGQMKFLGEHSELDVVFGPSTFEYWSEEAVTQEILPIPEPHDPWILLARWYLPQTGASLWRKQALLDVGGWKPKQPCCQEHELYSRLLIAGKRMGYCPSNGSVYRQWSEGTVCKRDRGEVRRRRMEIEQTVEEFLTRRQELTAERHWAINQARFEMARMAWQTDRAEAREMIRAIQRSQPDFVPGGVAAPRFYRLMYSVLGFERTEAVADAKRRLLQSA